MSSPTLRCLVRLHALDVCPAPRPHKLGADTHPGPHNLDACPTPVPHHLKVCSRHLHAILTLTRLSLVFTCQTHTRISSPTWSATQVGACTACGHTQFPMCCLLVKWRRHTHLPAPQSNHVRHPTLLARKTLARKPAPLPRCFTQLVSLFPKQCMKINQPYKRLIVA